MKALAILGAMGAATHTPIDELVVDEMVVRSCFLEIEPPRFDATHPDFRRQVLVRVTAFSCNYRDKGFFLRLQQVPAAQFFIIGSEFVGTVEATGADVTHVAPGDRVIGQNHYTASQSTIAPRDGLPTNQASKQYLVLHEEKLCAIPPTMRDDVAASFSIGAQTVYSMLRRAAPVAGSRALVPSATSSTSQFLIRALHARGVRVFASTTSQAFDDALAAMGVERVIHVSPGTDDSGAGDAIDRVAAEVGGFECVFDPFFDLHLAKSVRVMNPFGTYVTCGLSAQNPAAARRRDIRTLDATPVIATAIVKNVAIIGNCLGLRDDLKHALDDHARGALDVGIDSVYEGDSAGAFLDRTFNDRKRFGKVVYRY